MNDSKWYEKHIPTLAGKCAVVTGGNSGIGFFAARGLAYRGARVVLACRSEARAISAVERLRAEFPSADVSFLPLDLAEIASIDRFVAALSESCPKIDIFLHCAGVYYPREATTKDGLPMTVGVNFIGTCYLAERVRPLLGADSRMVFTTSLVDRFGRDRAVCGEGYGAYSKSKHLLSAYTVRLAALRGEGEPSYIAAHPGITATDLLSPEKTSHKPWFSRLGHDFLYLFTHSPEKAALTAVFAAAGDCQNGDCIGPFGLFGISGYPHKTRFAPSVRRRAEHEVLLFPAKNG